MALGSVPKWRLLALSGLVAAQLGACGSPDDNDLFGSPCANDSDCGAGLRCADGACEAVIGAGGDGAGGDFGDDETGGATSASGGRNASGGAPAGSGGLSGGSSNPDAGIAPDASAGGMDGSGGFEGDGGTPNGSGGLGSGGSFSDGGSSGAGGLATGGGGGSGGNAGSGGSSAGGGGGSAGSGGSAAGGSGGTAGSGGSGGNAGSGGSGGSGGNAGAGGSGGNAGAGGSGGNAGSGGGGSTDCATLRARVSALLAIAQACDPDSSKACSGSVKGECCSVVVDDPDSDATKEYLDALDTLLGHTNCLQICPAVLCPVPGPGTCSKSGDGDQGRCRASFGAMNP